MPAIFAELYAYVSAVMSHWASLATGGIVMFFISAYERHKKKSLSWESYAIVLGVFLFYSMFAAWNDEHRNTVSVAAEKAFYAGAAFSCGIDLKSSKQETEAKQSLADVFQKAFVSQAAPQAQQAANIASCINNLAKLNPSIRHNISVFSVPISAIEVSSTRFVSAFTAHKRYMSEVLITTNITAIHSAGVLSCSASFDTVGTPSLPANGASVVAPQTPVKISDHEYSLRVSNTGSEWGPNSPIYLAVTSSTETPGKCIFTPSD